MHIVTYEKAKEEVINRGKNFTAKYNLEDPWVSLTYKAGAKRKKNREPGRLVWALAYTINTNLPVQRSLF